MGSGSNFVVFPNLTEAFNVDSASTGANSWADLAVSSAADRFEETLVEALHCDFSKFFPVCEDLNGDPFSASSTDEGLDLELDGAVATESAGERDQPGTPKKRKSPPKDSAKHEKFQGVTVRQKLSQT